MQSLIGDSSVGVTLGVMVAPWVGVILCGVAVLRSGAVFAEKYRGI